MLPASYWSNLNSLRTAISIKWDLRSLIFEIYWVTSESSNWITPRIMTIHRVIYIIWFWLKIQQISFCIHDTHDQDPCHISQFSRFKTTLRRRRFQFIEVIKRNLQKELNNITETEFLECFGTWRKRQEKYIVSNGRYSEDDKVELMNKQISCVSSGLP